jgi:microcystin degradation protein MlrC
MPRLAVARLWFCSNSFTPRRTRVEDLTAHEWTDGATAWADRRDPGGEIAGVRSFVATRPDWDVTMLRCASAPPGGPLSAEVFGSWMADLEDALRRGRFDGIYLSLHGACQAEGDPAADVTILRRVRALVGHTPVVASFDLRANLSEETAILLDGASANRAWPRGGGDQAAIRALSLLEGILAGQSRPVGALARVPMVMPEPFLFEALSELWRDSLPLLEQKVLDASVFGGFAWGDSPYAGPSALVWADRDAGVAREVAARLALMLARWRTRLVPRLPTPESLFEVLQLPPGSTLLLDPSDDPALGALADTPELLRALLAAVAQGRIDGPVTYAALHDPDTVAACAAAGVGQRIERPLGARATLLYGQPVPVDATVIRVVDTARHGSCAVLRVGGVDVVVMSQRPGTIGPDLLEDVGLPAEKARLVAVKGAHAARAAFAELGAEAVACECPGPAAPDLLRLPFHYVPANRRMSVYAEPGDMSGLATRAVPRGTPAVQMTDDADSHEKRRTPANPKRPETLDVPPA